MAINKIVARLVIAVLAGGVSLFVQRTLAAWGILDPFAKRIGEWLRVTVTPDQIAWTIALVVAVALYFLGLLAMRRWMRGPSPSTAGAPIIQNYHNCIVHQNPDGTIRAEPKQPHWDRSQPTYVVFKPAGTEILSANNVSSVTDTGTGEFEVTFVNPVAGEYVADVDTGPYIPVITTKYADSVSVQLQGEEPERIKVVVRKLSD